MQPDLISGRYRVVRAIGHGGMGTVWLCRDEVLSRDVAVKQMGALPGEDTQSTTRAMREARVSAALNQENVVAVYDVVDHDGGTWLVMEYFPSQTLSELVADEGTLPAERVARIGAQVAGALASAHELGIVHRDVKPGNVLVGAGDVSKLSDFGIARGHTDMSLTQTGMMTGTPGYFSPELARGGDPSFASDAWAFGATLYTAVEGMPPYGMRTNALATLSAIAREVPPVPERAGVLAPVIASLMQPEPSQRWSMQRSREELRRAVAGSTSDGQTRVFAAGAGATADAGAAAAGVAASEGPGSGLPDDGFTSRWETTAASDPPPGDEHEHRRSWWLAALVALIVVGIGAAAWAAFAPDGGSSPSQNTTAADKKHATSPKTQTPRSEAVPSTEPTTPPTTTPTQKTDAGSASQAADFVSHYYTLVPDDLDAGWGELSPSFQAATTRAGYDDFWSQYSSVDVTQVHAVSPTVVTYTISYDGSTPENKEIGLVRDGSSYLIDSDGPQ